MNIRSQPIKEKVNELDLNDLVIDALRDIKGKNIVKLDLTKLVDAPTDYFIICEGESSTQVRSLADNVQKRVKTELGLLSNHLEGSSGSKWILVDYFDTIVHIFYPETREFYDLEDLWSDAHSTQYESV